MQEINLYDLLKHYAKYWVFILLFSIAGLGAGLIYNNYVQQPLYKSNATMLVLNTSGSSDAKTVTINNYLELLKSRRVLEPVVQKLNISDSYEDILGSVSTSNDKNTEVVKLTIATASPEKSQQLVDATITSFKDEVNRLYKTDTIQVIDSANLPDAPYNVRKTIQLALFTAAGFLFAIIVVFFIYDYRLSNGGVASATASATPSVAVPQPVAKKPSTLARYKANRHAKKQAKQSAKATKAQEKARLKEAKTTIYNDGTIIIKPVRDPKTGRFASKQKPVAKKSSSNTTRKK